MEINFKKISLNSILVIALLFNLTSAKVLAHCCNPNSGYKGHCHCNMKQKMDEMFTEIGVTPEQKQKIDAIMQDSRTKEQAIHKCMHEKKKALMQYMMTSEATKAQALSQEKEIECLHNQLAEIRINSVFETKKILTPQQQRKMAEFHQKHIAEFEKKHEEFYKTCPID